MPTVPRLDPRSPTTCDAPDLFAAAIDQGATHIYLEKPGAETAKTLIGKDARAGKAARRGCGRRAKNVAKYSCAALDSLTDPKEGTRAPVGHLGAP